MLRLKRNVLTNSNVGVLFANSEDGISDYNRALRRRRRLRARPARHADDGAGEDVLARTGSREPGTGNDMAGVVDFAWKNDRFNYGAQYLDIGEKFNAEMGYIPRLDIRAGKVQGGMDAAAEVAAAFDS